MSDIDIDMIRAEIREEILISLSIEAEFTGWDYGHDNRLEISLHYDWREISSTSVHIHPSGYERERD